MGLPEAVAYFSMEFGVSEVLPNYSGGLGILAGDHLKAASRPRRAAGRASGCSTAPATSASRSRSTAGRSSTTRSLDPQGLPLHLLDRRRPGAPVLVVASRMPGGRMLRARVWAPPVGRVPLLLLDSDIEENDADLRGVTDRLYGGDQDHRIRQEILVGIGGVRAVRAFCARVRATPTPDGVPHQRGTRRASSASSGSASWSATPRASTSTRRWPRSAPAPSSPPTPRCRRASTGSRVDLVRHYFDDVREAHALLPGVPIDRVLALGAEDDPSMFNMAHMGLRLAQRANGVSKLHGEVVAAGCSGALWRGLRRRRGADRLGDQRRARPDLGGPRDRRAASGRRAPHARGARSGAAPSDAVLWDLRDDAARAAGRRGAPAGARVVAASAAPSAPELGWTDARLRPGRADRRLRPARAHLQAADADAARPRAAAGAAARPGASGAAGGRGQVAPGGRRRQGAHPADRALRRRRRRAAPDRRSCPTTTCRWPATCTGAATSG